MIAALIIGGCVVAFAVVIGVIAVILDRDDARGAGPVYTFAPAAVDATPRGPAAGAEGTTYRPDPGVLSGYWRDSPTDVPGAGMVAGETPAQPLVWAHETPAAGDEAPGPDCLPEGDTQMLWPPQEAPGPGALIGVVVYDDGNQLTKAVAASAAVAALPVDEYLGQLADATAYTDERPFTDYLRDSVVMPIIRDEVA